jgi:ornithine--oxo-acid transaminase
VATDEGLINKSAELGQYLIDKLQSLQSPNIKEIRGRGLWIGVELIGSARPFCEALMEEGILCKETHDHVLRIAPPLVISKEEIDWAFEHLAKVLTK